MPRTITPQQLGAALALRDLSDPADGPHAMQLVAAAITDALAARWRCPVVVHRAGPVVTVAENYELLGYPPDATTRDARYTRYVDDTHLLRSHTSAMVPAALRRLAGRDLDAVMACPGLVYRRDVVDPLHVGEPHQLDLWRVRSGPRLGRADLEEMIELVVSAVLPAAAIARWRRSIPTPTTASRSRCWSARSGSSCSSAAWPEATCCAPAGSTRSAGRAWRSASASTGR